MRIAFYAPLKPPDHDLPSGDRRLARLFLAALAQAGHEPALASRLRSFDPAGEPRRQARLAALGRRSAARFLEDCARRPDTRPELWFTYHLSYKAPDWIGPAVATALGIPYVVAEASFAKKRAGGRWYLGHDAVADALARADAVIGINSADRAGVVPCLAAGARWVALKPFLDVSSYKRPHARRAGPPRLVAVAMMRSGDKLASYRVLGRALARLRDLAWSLEIIGDGPARARVAAALAPLGSRVTYRGALVPAAVARRLGQADLAVWPAINEAIGMALLEAQASGLAVVAGASGGVADIVVPGVTGLLAKPGDVAAFAAALRRLIVDSGTRRAMAVAARRRARAVHDIAGAARHLDAVLSGLGRVPAA